MNHTEFIKIKRNFFLLLITFFITISCNEKIHTLKEKNHAKNKTENKIFRPKTKEKNNKTEIKDIFYKNGKLKKRIKYKYNRGKKSSATVFNDKNEIIELIQWHRNGNKREEIIFKKNKLQKAISWYRNKQKKSETYIEEGYINLTEFYKTGIQESQKNYKIKPKKDRKFKKDRKIYEGKQIKWYRDGHKKSEKNYRNGKLHKKQTLWFLNNKIRSVKNYKNGILNGKQTVYSDKNNKKAEAYYKEGKIQQIILWKDDAKIDKKINKKDNIERFLLVEYNKIINKASGLEKKLITSFNRIKNSDVNENHEKIDLFFHRYCRSF